MSLLISFWCVSMSKLSFFRVEVNGDNLCKTIVIQNSTKWGQGTEQLNQQKPCLIRVGQLAFRE